MQASYDDERAQIISIFEGLSPEAKLLIIDVIRIENEHLNFKQPTGLADQFVRRAEGIIK
jgi:hypothetical protein